jgi:hypothetical protein
VVFLLNHLTKVLFQLPLEIIEKGHKVLISLNTKSQFYKEPFSSAVDSSDPVIHAPVGSF